VNMVVFITISRHTKFEMSSFIHYREMTGAPNLKKMGHVIHARFDDRVTKRPILHIVSSHTKFEVPSFSLSRQTPGSENF